MLKILSWNIRQGGASRKVTIAQRIIDIAPAIIILSEYRNNTHGQFLRQKLMQAGYRFQSVSAASKEDNSVLIASNIACDTHLYNHSKDLYKHNIILTTFDAFNVLGVYLPHKKKHKLFQHLKEVAQLDKPGIITGDFNTGKNGIDQKGSSFWYEDELIALEKLGYKDAFRHIKGDIKEYSWYSHQGNGYRYDHYYISEHIIPLVTDCYYLHKWREEGLSDHSPMILELG